MPRTSKPTVQPKRPAPKKRAAVRRASKPLKKAVPATIVSRGPSLLLSHEEKREMILAHAAMRQTRDPVHMATLWAGVAATFIVIAGAWAWAFGPVFFQNLHRPLDPSISQIFQGVSDVQHQANAYVDSSDLKKQLDEANGRLQALSDQATAKQQALDVMAAAVNGTSTSNIEQHSLFQPSPEAPVTKPVTP